MCVCVCWGGGGEKINPKHLAIEKKTTAKCIDRYIIMKIKKGHIVKISLAN